MAIQIVAGTETSTIVDSVGNLVEVVPSYCDRIGALDVLARGGLGTADAAAEKATLSDLESTLAEEIQRDLGMSLEETRWPEMLPRTLPRAAGHVLWLDFPHAEQALPHQRSRYSRGIQRHRRWYRQPTPRRGLPHISC